MKRKLEVILLLVSIGFLGHVVVAAIQMKEAENLRKCAIAEDVRAISDGFTWTDGWFIAGKVKADKARLHCK